MKYGTLHTRIFVLPVAMPLYFGLQGHSCGWTAAIRKRFELLVLLFVF